MSKEIATTFLLLSCFLFSGELTPNVWYSYINNPSDRNYLLCKNQINTVFNQASWNDELFPFLTSLWEEDGPFYKLLDLAENSNVLALDLCFLLDPYMKGAWGEDLGVTFSYGLKHDPELFLILCDQYLSDDFSQWGTEKILGYYILQYRGDVWPPEDISLQIQEFEKRIQALKSVQNDNYIELRDICIRLLEDEKKELLEKK